MIAVWILAVLVAGGLATAGIGTLLGYVGDRARHAVWREYVRSLPTVLPDLLGEQADEARAAVEATCARLHSHAELQVYKQCAVSCGVFEIYLYSSVSKPGVCLAAISQKGGCGVRIQCK